MKKHVVKPFMNVVMLIVAGGIVYIRLKSIANNAANESIRAANRADAAFNATTQMAHDLNNFHDSAKSQRDDQSSDLTAIRDRLGIPRPTTQPSQ